MVKRPKGGGYKTSSGYTIRKDNYEKLRRAIKNFNARITRAKAKAGPFLLGAYPETVKITNLRENIKSKRDLDKIVRQLEMFKGEGLQLTEYGGQIVTKAEKKITSRAIAAENVKRARLQKLTESIQEQTGRFPTQAQFDIKEISPDYYMQQRRKSLESLISGVEIDNRALILQQNYINKVEMVLNEALIQGVATTETVQMANRIIEIVSGLTPEQMVIAQTGIPTLQISNIYVDPDFFAYAIDEYLSAWEEFAALW